MEDPFKSHQRSLESPATQHFEIAPADGIDLPLRPRVIKVLSEGTIAIRDETGTIVIYPVAAGEILPISPVGIEATQTTATAIGWV